MYGNRFFDKTKALILAVYNRPALWNQRHVDYKNERLHDGLIADIACMVGLPKGEVEWEWKKILNQYDHECQKLQDHYRFFGNVPFVSNWPYFELMSFVKEHRPSNANELIGERMPFSHQPRDERYFMSESRFVGDRDFRPQYQLMPNTGFGSQDTFLKERKTLLLPPTNVQDFMPLPNSLNRQDFRISGVARNIPQQTFVKERKFPAAGLRGNASASRFNRRKRKRRNVSNIDDRKVNNASARSKVDGGNVIKKAKEDASLPVKNSPNDNVAQGKDHSKNEKHFPSNVVEVNDTGKSPTKKNDGISAECKSSDLEFFQSLLPYLKIFPRIQKLVTKNKIQLLVLEEYAKITRNAKENSANLVQNKNMRKDHDPLSHDSSKKLPSSNLTFDSDAVEDGLYKSFSDKSENLVSQITTAHNVSESPIDSRKANDACKAVHDEKFK